MSRVLREAMSCFWQGVRKGFMVLVPHSAPRTSQGLCHVLGEQWGTGETQYCPRAA